MRRKKKHKKAPQGKTKIIRVTPSVPLRKRLPKALLFMFLAGLFTFVLNRAGLLNQLETTFLDAQMRLDVPDEESQVVIVDITQSDFQQTFQGQTRPLKPDALWALINAVAKGRPCIIGVDIDTHFEQFKDFKVADEWPPVIWSREVAELPADVTQNPVPLDVLGGQNPAFNEKSGIPLLIDDAGSKTTRRYVRLIETTLGKQPSFAWAVYRERQNRDCGGVTLPPLSESADPLLIRYSRGIEGIGRTRLTASNVISFAEDVNWPNNELVKDKIVLIGGSYLGEDRHDTPLGRMTGVEVMANVVESELRGGGIKPPSYLTMGLLLIFDGFLLIALFQFLPLRKALLFSLPVIVILSLACSFLTYRSFSRWAFFAPMMIGVMLAELLDMARGIYTDRVKRLKGAS
jgi:CHASE2 domain-containing sensor protein